MLREAGVMAIYGSDYEQVIALGARAAELPCATDSDRFNRAAVAAYGADVSGDHAGAAVPVDRGDRARRAPRQPDPAGLGIARRRAHRHPGRWAGAREPRPS